MSEHRCFTVSETSYLRALDDEDRRADCVAVHYQKPPRINDDGRTTFSLNFPLLIVSAYAANSREVAERVRVRSALGRGRPRPLRHQHPAFCGALELGAQEVGGLNVADRSIGSPPANQRLLEVLAPRSISLQYEYIESLSLFESMGIVVDEHDIPAFAAQRLGHPATYFAGPSDHYAHSDNPG